MRYKATLTLLDTTTNDELTYEATAELRVWALDEVHGSAHFDIPEGEEDI